MRVLRIADVAVVQEHVAGSDVPGWVARKLREAGFDLTREIIYRYSGKARETLFLQYLDDVAPVPELVAVGEAT